MISTKFLQKISELEIPREKFWAQNSYRKVLAKFPEKTSGLKIIGEKIPGPKFLLKKILYLKFRAKNFWKNFQRELDYQKNFLTSKFSGEAKAP